MIDQRKEALDKISRVLAITRLDIEQRQAIADYSINIHAENYWRDVFNFVYGSNFENANDSEVNAPFIDLVDKKNKVVVQITTTRTKEKIEKSLGALFVDKYKGYKVYIYYLLEKAAPKDKTIDELNVKYNVDLLNVLRDSSDFFKNVSSLETNELVALCNKYFAPHEVKYTDEQVLNLVIGDLIKRHGTVSRSHDDELSSVSVDKKILINGLTELVSFRIRESIDYAWIIENIYDQVVKDDLKALVIDGLYKGILVNRLKKYINSSDLNGMKLEQLHFESEKNSVDFNKVIFDLHSAIRGMLVISDFNSIAVSWIIVSYFFEYCDAGRKE